MALRRQNNSHAHGRVPSYYVNRPIYDGSYAPTDTFGRTSRRIHDGLVLTANYGLDTTSDDINSSPYSSPFYINGRYNSDNLTTQRANSASVQGTKRLLIPEEYIERLGEYTVDYMETSIKMWQGKQLRFKRGYRDNTIGNTLIIKNTCGCTGILSIFFSATQDGEPLYETAIDLCEVSTDKFEVREVYSMIPFSRDANPRKEMYVRMEIWDEVGNRESANPFNTGRYIEIGADGFGTHESAIYELGDKNMPVEETIEWTKHPSQPVMGLIATEWHSIPVNSSNDDKLGAVVSYKGREYYIFAIQNDTTTQVLVYDRATNSIVPSTIKVDGRAKEINLVQANRWVYYVDGYSPLQKFKINKWVSKSLGIGDEDLPTATVNATIWQSSPLGGVSGTFYFDYKESANSWQYANQNVSLATYGITLSGTPNDKSQIMVKATVTGSGGNMKTKIDVSTYMDTMPVIGASLIIYHNNRIYLSGFRYDPNLMQASTITGDGADFDSYPWRWYVPDAHPDDTSNNPITAIVEYNANEFMVMLDHGWKRLESNVNLEDGTPTAISAPTDMGGAMSSGDVVNYQGVVYSFNPETGLRRFNKAAWNDVPGSEWVNSHFERVDMSKRRKLWGYANKLYLNYTDKLDGKAKCLVWDQLMNYQQYPWFQDYDLPFCDVRVGHDFDLVGIHPDMPCIMQLYAEDTWRRLDTPIVFERHTKYLSIPGNMNDMVLRRVHAKVLSNSNRWWWMGISADKQFLRQTRGRDVTYRIPCWDTLEIIEPPTTAFPFEDEYEENATLRLSVMNIKIQGSSVQVKMKCKTFRQQSNLISVALEVTPKQYL